MNSVKVGVIGVGHLGELHLKKYINIPEAELTGFFDVNEDTNKRISDAYGIKAFRSIEELLNNVEAVSIVVPTTGHRDAAVKAAEKGIPVFVEKPIASTLAEADDIIKAANSNKVKLQVGHIERFNPAYRNLRHELINPKFIEAHRLASFNPRGLDVPVILDLMIHDIDIILKLVQSEIKEIDASGVGVVGDTADIVNARINFENGAVANVTASRISQKKMRKMRIFQKDSYISMDFVEGEAEVFRMSDGDGKFQQPELLPVMDLSHNEIKRVVGFRRIGNDGKDSIELELSSFVQSVINDTPPAVTGEEARKALEVALQIVEKIDNLDK
ncbi:Gfo/Idh/MocA family protein [candidate division KSB1 bacterium]